MVPLLSIVSREGIPTQIRWKSTCRNPNQVFKTKRQKAKCLPRKPLVTETTWIQPWKPWCHDWSSHELSQSADYRLSGWLVQHLQKQSEISHWGPHPTREDSKLTSTASPEKTRDQPVNAIFGTPDITFDNPNISKQITEKFPQHFEGNMTISTVITSESYSQSVRPHHTRHE
jgi:hypothetical protein